MLLEEASEVNAEDDNAQMSFCEAIQNGQVEIIETLLKTGKVDVNARDKHGDTPLLTLFHAQSDATSELCCNSRLAEPLSDDEYNQLRQALIQRYDSSLALLLEAGADRDSSGGNAWQPISLAVARRNETAVRELLRRGADPNLMSLDGQSLLNNATYNDSEAITRLLLEAGAAVDFQDENGYTALMNAAANGSETITQMLLEGAANTALRTDRGYTALTCASDPLCNGDQDRYNKVVTLLLNSGADIQAQDVWGWTALASAVRTGRLKTVKLLICQGADCAWTDKEAGTSLLSYAAQTRDSELVCLLLDGGCDVNHADVCQRTPLFWAVRRDQDHRNGNGDPYPNTVGDIVKVLLNASAKHEQIDDDGLTAMDWAVEYEHEDAAEMLRQTSSAV